MIAQALQLAEAEDQWQTVCLVEYQSLMVDKNDYGCIYHFFKLQESFFFHLNDCQKESSQ